MKIKKISFKNYRNLVDSELYPDEKVNVIFGNNAQGKTNLLESLWLFTGGKSFRGAKDSDLLTFGTEESRLELSFLSNQKNYTIKIAINQQGRKTLINGVPCISSSELIGKFCAVVFSPAHLELIKGGPAERRRFLDTAICQAEPRYAKAILKYNHVLTQRNTLLKDAKYHHELIDTLEIWDEKLAGLSGFIIAKRNKYSEFLLNFAKNFYGEIAGKNEQLSIKYTTNAAKIFSESDIAAQMKLNLSKTQKDDLVTGFTTIGPHRDDLVVLIDQKLSKKFSSQGQQRSAVLALKLSEAAILNKVCKKEPVILLDDVLSELDKSRQNFVLNSISKGQIFITCCETDQVSKLKNGKLFCVDKGIITQSR